MPPQTELTPYQLVSGRARVRFYMLCDGTMPMTEGTVTGYIDGPAFIVAADDGTEKAWSAQLPFEVLAPQTAGPPEPLPRSAFPLPDISRAAHLGAARQLAADATIATGQGDHAGDRRAAALAAVGQLHLDLAHAADEIAAVGFADGAAAAAIAEHMFYVAFPDARWDPQPELLRSRWTAAAAAALAGEPPARSAKDGRS